MFTFNYSTLFTFVRNRLRASLISDTMKELTSFSHYLQSYIIKISFFSFFMFSLKHNTLQHYSRVSFQSASRILLIPSALNFLSSVHCTVEKDINIKIKTRKTDWGECLFNPCFIYRFNSRCSGKHNCNISQSNIRSRFMANINGSG